MPLTRFAMIVKAPGYDPELHRASLSSPAFSTSVVGVSDYEHALSAAIDLMTAGVQLIELCGGFTPDEADQLHIGIGGKVPVGVVRYSAEEQEHLSVLFG